VRRFLFCSFGSQHVNFCTSNEVAPVACLHVENERNGLPLQLSRVISRGAARRGAAPRAGDGVR